MFNLGMKEITPGVSGGVDASQRVVLAQLLFNRTCWVSGWQRDILLLEETALPREGDVFDQRFHMLRSIVHSFIKTRETVDPKMFKARLVGE